MRKLIAFLALGINLLLYAQQPQTSLNRHQDTITQPTFQLNTGVG